MPSQNVFLIQGLISMYLVTVASSGTVQAVQLVNESCLWSAVWQKTMGIHGTCDINLLMVTYSKSPERSKRRRKIPHQNAAVFVASDSLNF
jgi:hypothetical protein